MKGFKPTMKMAHGGKVRYAEGGLSEKLGPPDGGVKKKKGMYGPYDKDKSFGEEWSEKTMTGRAASAVGRGIKKIADYVSGQDEEYKKGGKVRHYAQGSDGGVKGPPDEYETEYFSTRKKPAPVAPKRKSNSVDEITDTVKRYYSGPAKSGKGKYTPPNMDDADKQIRNMLDSGGYKKGGKVQKVMHEFKAGELHSGNKKGPMVKSRKQAIAIALSEAGKSKKG